jgi:hypothetical protein
MRATYEFPDMGFEFDYGQEDWTRYRISFSRVRYRGMVLKIPGVYTNWAHPVVGFHGMRFEDGIALQLLGCKRVWP